MWPTGQIQPMKVLCLAHLLVANWKPGMAKASGLLQNPGPAGPSECGDHWQGSE